MATGQGTRHIDAWPEQSLEAPQLVLDACGEPDEASDSRLIWHQAGPWKRASGSGLTTRHLLHFKPANCTTDSAVMHAKMVGYRLHAVGTRSISTRHCLVTVAKAISIGLQWLCERSPLHHRHLPQYRPLFERADLRLEHLIAQKHLMPDQLQRTRLANSFRDKPDIVADRPPRLRSKLRQQPLNIQPRWRRHLLDARSIIAPDPIACLSNQARPHRIEHNVPAQLQQVGLLLNENGFVTPLKDMTNPTVTPIQRLRIHPVQLPHTAGEIAIRRFHEQMTVVAHRTVSMHGPIAADSGAGLSECQT